MELHSTDFTHSSMIFYHFKRELSVEESLVNMAAAFEDQAPSQCSGGLSNSEQEEDPFKMKIIKDVLALQ